MVLTETTESLFQKVRDAAGIHFSTFQDPKEKGKTDEVKNSDEETLAAAEAAGRQVIVRSGHRPNPAWKARFFAPADPNADPGITILEYR